MIYEVTDNRVLLGKYFFDMDVENNIHVYAKEGKSLKYIKKIKAFRMNYNKFLYVCNELLKKL